MDIALHLMTKSTTGLLKTGGSAVAEGVTTGAVGGATVGTMVTPGIGTAAGFIGGTSAGLAAGMAKAGFDAGMASDMVQSMKDSGIDIKDPKSVEKALKDKDKMDAWQKHALKYNIPIAAFDLFSAGLGGKIFTPAKSVGSKIAKGIAETAIQAGLDASGEAAGQLAADKRLDAKGIFSEVAGGLPQQAVEVATGMLNNEKPVNATSDKGEQSISNAIQYKLAQGEIASKKAEILASLEPDGNGGVIMTPEAKIELDKLENARVQVQEPTQQSATNTEGEKPIAFASKQQESDGKPASTEANKGATIESAVIEIGGETFEGKNHAEAILKAQQAGKDISQVDRQGEGMFKLSDGSIISREQAKEAFGADKAEMLITQDEAANKANDDYEKVKREFKREDIANKIASNDTGGIAQVPIEDVPLLVEERTNPTEDVLTVNPLQENITLTVPQPTITGAQEQEGADGVQAVSENVQEAGTADVPSVPVGKTTQKTELDARGKLDERAKSLGYTGIKQFNTQNVLNENLNAEEKQLLDDYSSHKASIDNEKDSSVIESMNDEDFGNWAKANDVQRNSNGYVNNQSDLDLAKKRIDILNKRGNTKQADIELKQLKGSTKKSDWTVDSWNERFDELLTQEEIDEINKERSDFNKKLNEVLNEPTKKQDVPVSVLDQSGATDSDTEKGTRKVEERDEYKESKFNIRQRLGIAVNDALAKLADKDRLMYKVLQNSILLEEADAEIAKDIDAAFESVVADDNKVSQLAGVFAKAGRLINIFEEAIKNTDDQQAKEFLIEKLNQIRVATQKKATLGGQAVQALSTVGNILPERDMVVLGVIAQREATINKEGLKTIESEAGKDVDKAVSKAIDEIVSTDPKIKQLESKIAELEAKIAAGKTAKRKEAVKKAIDKLDSLINNNLAFSDATGAVAIAKQGLIVAREAIKAGGKVVDAIEKAVRFVNAKTGNKKWDEKAFRDAIENSLVDVREDLDALYDEKKSLQESKKKLKDSIRIGLKSGDFSDLKSHLADKGMLGDEIDTYVSDLKDKHEKAIIYAVSKRIDKNLGLTVKRPVEKSLAYIEANSEPLTADEIEARLKNEIDKVSAKVEKLVAKRIEKNTATDEELAEKKKLTELKRLESQKSHEKADKLAMDIFKNEPLTEEEINARLNKKKKELDDKIESERAKRIKKNLETTKEKQLRIERENLERDIREKKTSQIAKKIANSEPLTADEKMSLLKKKNALEDLTDSEQRRLKELYDEVERVFIDPDLKIEAINNLRHEAQKLIPKTRLSSFLSYYNSNIYYPNILSGGWTSALNLKDAFFNTIDLVPQMRKGGLEAYKDQFKGLKEGLRKAKIGMAEGFVNQGLLNNAEFDKLDLGKKTSEDFAKEGSKIAKYYSKWVGRVMALPNTIGEATKFSVLSFVIQKDLESQGLKGRALIDKKNELLYGTFGKREELTPKARKLVYGTENPTKTDAISEAKVQRTVTNMILADMQNQMTTKEGQEAIEIATQIKDKVTYQQTATGILGFLPYAERKLGTMGKSGKAIQEFTRKFLGVEFLNTSMNVANTALDYTPYGYARANDKSVSRGLDAAIRYLTKEDFIIDEIGYSEGKSNEEKARIKEKANRGMALLGGILLTTIVKSLSDDDDEKSRFITGSLKPIDYLNQKTKYQHEKEANLAIPAYSIKLPGIGWWNYSGTPLVGVLSIAGNVSDYLYAKKSQDLTLREYGKAIPYGAVNTLKAILIDGTPIGSQIERNKISKNTDAENTESQLGQWMAHKTADMVGGLVPNLIKSLAKDFDSTNYTPDDIAMMVAKSTGVLNMYSAFGGNPNVPYAVDLLGNKISSKSGEKYFNIQKSSVSEEDKKIYKLLLDVYKEPSNFPSYINPKMPVFANEIKEKEYKDKLDVIDKLYKRGSITKEGMENRIGALEKESAKIDDIGNDKVLYTKALETCGELFKRGLQDNYDAIKDMPNDADKRKEVDEILKEAKRLTKAQFAVQPDEEEPTKTE